MAKKVSRKKATSPSIKRIGFVIKHEHPEAARLGLEAARYCLSQGASVYFATETRKVAQELKRNLRQGKTRVQIVEKTALVKHVDLIVVFGGDGTFLSIARLMSSRSVPVLGVNMGQLGFLTEIKRSEALDTIADLLEGKKPKISERTLLEVTVKRKNKTVFQGPVVNDAVISKGAIARIIGIQVGINGTYANTVRADGLIVCTPTGSTAYSLAAGGPIMEPSLPALAITPICPHSLTQRPIVVPLDSEIRLCLTQRPGHVLLTLDGQDAVNLQEGDVVTVKRFKKHSLQLISAPDRDYFGLLREKLKFGARE